MLFERFCTFKTSEIHKNNNIVVHMKQMCLCKFLSSDKWRRDEKQVKAKLSFLLLLYIFCGCRANLQKYKGWESPKTNKKKSQHIYRATDHILIGNVHKGRPTIMGHFGHTYLSMSDVFYTILITLVQFLLRYRPTPKWGVLYERSLQ